MNTTPLATTPEGLISVTTRRLRVGDRIRYFDMANQNSAVKEVIEVSIHKNPIVKLRNEDNDRETYESFFSRNYGFVTEYDGKV